MGNSTSAFNCQYQWTSTNSKDCPEGEPYIKDLEPRQYRQLPYNFVRDDREAILATRKRKSRTLWLSDTVKLVIHNYILDNINRNEVNGTPLDNQWRSALLIQILREERRATLNDVERWTNNHFWIRWRHCQFKDQKQGGEEAAESTRDLKKNVKALFKVQQVYKTGKGGKEYKVNLHFRQFPRLPNNFIGPKKTIKREQPKKKVKKENSRCLRKKETKEVKYKKPVIGHTIKLVIHNFILENVNKGEPYGVPGDDKWVKAALTRIHQDDELVTATDVERWVREQCWIVLTHNDFTDQKARGSGA